MKRHALLLLGAGMIALAGCHQPVEPPQVGFEDKPTAGEPLSKEGRHEIKARQADFLNRIRAADPQSRTIERAVLNENNELGLILDRSVQMDDIPKLMRSMLGEMAKEFPTQDLTIIAYAPSNPPRKIGTAHLDARSKEMTYKPEK